ncbi:MAG TPA: DnaJ domain-containing protein [Devosiaceae bacterium]|jgi:hypothetical protein|nr:DnaJ domain-containing protein [Devosiaceae bacterium]
MNILLVLFAGLVGLLVITVLFRRVGKARLLRSLRWIIGGTAAVLALFLILRGRADIGGILGAVAFTVLRYGRLGPLVIGGSDVSEDNESGVKSRFITMNLDHATGDISGRVIAGRFKGADLMELGEYDTRELLAEVSGDPDSLALLETWLDKNRAGWREYFAEQDAAEAGEPPPGGGSTQADPEAEAYSVLGLEPGATADDIREAHRNLMKRVHPDQGGSTYLASKINEAKDRLLKKVSG